MTYKVNKNNKDWIYTPSNLLNLNALFTFLIIALCLGLFNRFYNDFYNNAINDIQRYHESVFVRSMSTYKAQLAIPDNYKDMNLVKNSNIIQSAFDNPTLSGCEKIWDVVFSLDHSNMNNVDVSVSSNKVSVEVIKKRTCRFFLINNNKSTYYFDYALNM